ncbi:unnamed protein product [Leptosia nina]|uniref:Serpin domain-containing protein n=1 Tax=Leptosia nina TaxID=320188 RepID=A0AAV1K4S0_9NEOP
MNILVHLIVYAAIACAENIQERRSKLPYIADAVGNSIPRPSSVPATVGSPVNLLTPDRYEFYTFDESGELVKRLMTLEEIQAIVAAGEDADGLVTFANENQPTIAFNFSQPPYTKVNSVVTNVQNVLKAQMEAHKNNPQMQPTLDTPDVSDSWSLILPSIFGNTGVDIIPDKTSGSFITPETETIEVDNLNGDYLYSFSKEANNPQITSSPQMIESTSKVSTTVLDSISKHPPSLLPQSTIMVKPSQSVTTTVSIKPTTEINKLSTEKPKISHSTLKPTAASTTAIKPHYSSLRNYTTKPNWKITPVNLTTLNNEISSLKEKQTTKTFTTVTEKTENSFIPVSTVSYITQSVTNKPSATSMQSTTVSNINLSSNKVTEKTNLTMNPHQTSIDSHSGSKDDEYFKTNTTTITTQSVSPSTIPSSTVVTSSEKSILNGDSINKETHNTESDEPTIMLFDVAQSISQIASDLGGNFAPLPTSSILDTTKETSVNIESKESVDIDIPQENEKINTENPDDITTPDIFVKVSTIDAHSSNNAKESIEKVTKPEDSGYTTTFVPETTTQMEATTASNFIETTTLDLILSDSMGDLLSQVVYQTNNIISTSKDAYNSKNNNNTIDPVLINNSEYQNNDSTANQTVSKQNAEVQVKVAETSTVLSTTTPKILIDFNSESKSKMTTEKSEILENTENNLKDDEKPHFVPVSLSSSKNSSEFEILKPSHSNKNSVLIPKTEITHNDSLLTGNQGSLQSQIHKEIPESSLKIDTPSSIILNKDINAAGKDNTINLTKNKINNKPSDKIAEVPKFDELKKKFQKINIDDKELSNERNSSWKLISTVTPPKLNSELNNKHKPEGFYTPENSAHKHISLEFSKENQGLEVTTKDLGEDILQFVELCNELAFQYWDDITKHIDKKRSLVLSPYAITSMLAMMFMGARGATSGEMNEILKLDDMVTFNPHFTLKNISDSIDISPASGVAVSTFIRELYSDKTKGKILTFYKERAQQFYNGHVEEINFKLISDVIRRRTNLLVKRYTFGKIQEYMKTNDIVMQPPLASFSMNIFETDCTGSSVDGRDGEMYFVVSPNVRQRRLVPVPAVVYRTNFLAGYDPVLDATAAALGNTNSIISTLFLMPGQQGNIVHGEDLEALERRLLASNPAVAWNRLLRTLLPRIGLELQIPRFSHKSIFNVSSTLRKMGLKDLFNEENADLGGLNGPSKNLYLSDMVQLNSFVTCGESVISEQHHIEEYPESLEIEKIQRRRSARWLNWDEPRDYQRAFHDPHDVGDAMHLPLHLRPRQARLPARNSQPARLKFDRPFLFFVRHNPSGMILYVGRYNPRLLP